jgi:hypothetical protein
MLLIARGEPLQPYTLAKKLDAMLRLSKPRAHKRLGNKLTAILRQAADLVDFEKNYTVPIATFKSKNGTATTTIFKRQNDAENYTDEEIRQRALKLVKQHIVFSSTTPGDYSRWEAAELAAHSLKNEMRDKEKRAIQELDAFLKNRTKSTF